MVKSPHPFRNITRKIILLVAIKPFGAIFIAIRAVNGGTGHQGDDDRENTTKTYGIPGNHMVFGDDPSA